MYISTRNNWKKTSLYKNHAHLKSVQFPPQENKTLSYFFKEYPKFSQPI